MRLKSIKLAGFKSFVDPTTVSFPTNMSAIVGPNGCGKSNIIDAVRWVMGESSAKNLRGESMTDVIFNGSVNRKPVGQASIELIFDNSDGRLRGEYAAFSEISIRRRVTRDGQSDYFLNGQKCRRRDITDIFLGTGLGPRSYAIIEQGMISKLIEAKPEELRVFIEEAAGISKYKERRRETENRMRRTQENLERLTDIREELERQLAHLQRQAQAAERYTELKKEERLLKAQLQALQWRQLDQQVSSREQEIQQREVQLEAVIAEQRSLDASIEKDRERHAQLNEQFNEVQGRFYALGAEIARAEQGIHHQSERARQLRDDLQQTERQLQQAEEHLRSDASKQQSWREELAQVEPELELLEAQSEESAAALLEAEQTMNEWQHQWDEFNQRASEPRQRAEVQQSRIQHLEQALRRFQERVTRLEQEKNELAAGPVDEEIALLNEQLAELELQLEERQQRLDEAVAAIETHRERTQQLTADLDRERSELQRMRGRRASLEALQQAALGQTGGVVNEWLRQHGLADQPRLAEQLKVKDGWQTAVETVLGSQLQAVCIDDLSSVATAAAELSKGAVTLLDRSPVGQAAGDGDRLADKVSGDSRVATLLAGIHCAADLETALSQRSTLAPQESIVTPEGLWVGPNWLRVRRADDSQSGVLARQQELSELEVAVDVAEERVESLVEQLHTSREQLERAEQERDEAQRSLQQDNRRQGELRSELSARQVRVEQIASRRSQLNREIDEAREQFAIEQENLGEARMLLQEAIDQMQADSSERERMLAVRDESRVRLDQARQRARADRDAAHQLAVRQQSLRAQLDSAVSGIERTELQVAQLRERQQTLLENIAGSEEPVEELKLELEALLEKRLGVENELSEARRALEAVEHGLRQAEQSRHGVEQRAQGVRSDLERLRLDAQGLTVRRRTLQEQLIESQFDLETVLAALPEEATENAWQEQLEQVSRRIQRLGPINLAAIDEYKIQSERKHYLDAQNDDLVEALTTLENAIRRIDRETRNRFKETFDQVNQGLGELFPRVFGGGHAYLEMTGDDLLDTGITIMARPPGKRNSTIHLLSGGEKALTAIALVFSIFRLNPAPFCMLDEVDAPLDDVNVGRYARMVKEMSEHVQFIYISHNKIAMEMGDQLMGVTMHEPGVSRLVTVNIEEAAELAAS
ncbi:MAG: chromosome segregation protein SMC [Spongiibacteraceae bacterium]|jgi:chromosome segregation protein|nr:chromosome segregation protein SMC [Spongiibacteraceae bacterium]